MVGIAEVRRSSTIKNIWSNHGPLALPGALRDIWRHDVKRPLAALTDRIIADRMAAEGANGAAPNGVGIDRVDPEKLVETSLMTKQDPPPLPYRTTAPSGGAASQETTLIRIDPDKEKVDKRVSKFLTINRCGAKLHPVTTVLLYLLPAAAGAAFAFQNLVYSAASILTPSLLINISSNAFTLATYGSNLAAGLLLGFVVSLPARLLKAYQARRGVRKLCDNEGTLQALAVKLARQPQYQELILTLFSDQKRRLLTPMIEEQARRALSFPPLDDSGGTFVDRHTKLTYSADNAGLLAAYGDLALAKKSGGPAAQSAIESIGKQIVTISTSLGLHVSGRDVHQRKEDYLLLPADDAAQARIAARRDDEGRPMAEPPLVPGACFLGNGAMAEVYAAIDRRTGARVAIKILKDLTFRDRFEVEYLNMTKLDHPAAIKVHSYGFLDSAAVSHPFIVEEYMDEEWPDLRQYVHSRGGRLAPRDAAEIIRLVADAMAGISRTLHHRDLKLPNVFYNPRLHAIKIADFGLAKDPEAGDQSATGIVAGTPGQMAPYLMTYYAMSSERRAQDTDAVRQVLTKNDIYAAGAMLYRLVTGYALSWKIKDKITQVSNDPQLEQKRGIVPLPLISFFGDYREYAVAKSAGDSARAAAIRNRYLPIIGFQGTDSVVVIPQDLYVIIALATAFDPAETCADFLELEALLKRFTHGSPVVTSRTIGEGPTVLSSPPSDMTPPPVQVPRK